MRGVRASTRRLCIWFLPDLLKGFHVLISNNDFWGVFSGVANDVTPRRTPSATNVLCTEMVAQVASQGICLRTMWLVREPVYSQVIRNGLGTRARPVYVGEHVWGNYETVLRVQSHCTASPRACRNTHARLLRRVHRLIVLKCSETAS